MKFKFNSLIIGAGNISACFDNPQSRSVLTHAHAFYRHENFNLIGFVDTNIEKANIAAGLWNCQSFENIEEAFKKSQIDVISIAVPDEYHYDVLKTISKYKVKVVFLEKPIAKTIKQADEIIEIYKNIPVLINYSRRFVKEFYEIKEKIKNGDFGKYISGTGYYGKGVLHNGSHMVDLLRFLIGEIEDFDIINSIKDYYNEDPSISAILKFADGKIFSLNAVDCRMFTIFEADFIFEKARFKMKDLGFILEEYDIKDNEIFKGYKNLKLSKTTTTSLNTAMYNAVNNIYEFLTEKKTLVCNIKDAYKSMELPLKMIAKVMQ
jgi:predicted dehydrogenase